MSYFGDIGPAFIVAHSGLTVPASSLTMPSVSANGYVFASGTPTLLKYVSQPAVSITFSGGDGFVWLALHADLSTAVSGWTRRAGSHFLWVHQGSATKPADPAGGLAFCLIDITGGVITNVTTHGEVVSPPMSRQNSYAVAITGGTITGVNPLAVNTTPAGGYVLTVGGASQLNGALALGGALSQTAGTAQLGTNVGINQAPNGSYALAVNGLASVNGTLGLQTAPATNTVLGIRHARGSQFGLLMGPSDGDSGGLATQQFVNFAGSGVGSITLSATGTSFNTTSDARLKMAIATLTGALARVQALRPVSFLWQADGSPGVGFLADELQRQIPEAVTGLPDAVGPQGEIVPQQVDHSKIIPWLCAALQESVAQVQALTARVTSLEEALGV